jgi:Fe-S oxidoreductase/nitrate reductase gamma subunit
MGRTPYWQIDYGILIDLLAIPVAVTFCYGVIQHWRKIQSGLFRFRLTWDDFRHGLRREKLVRLLWTGLLGSRVYRKAVTGFFHAMVFWGMLVLFLGTLMVLLNVVFDVAVMSGGFYKWFMAFALDAAGLAVLIGIGFLLARRLGRYPRLFEPRPRSGFVFMELLLLTVVLTGFLLEGLRIRLTDAHELAFIGAWAARLLESPADAATIYTLLWWTHGLLALFFIAYIPFSPLTHLLFIPVNAAVAEPVMGADVEALDLASLETGQNGEIPPLGTPTLADYRPKRLLDFSACLWCGRCQEVCPATQTEKDLTPKGIIVTLAQWLQAGKMTDERLIDTVGMETLFECRTCAACVENCPALINPLKAIWSMRQNLMMERGEMPVQMLQAYRNMEALRHPFSSSASSTDWARGLDVPSFEAQKTEYLLWVGCAVTYEDRAQQIGRAMVNVLNHADVSYGIIAAARCTGDPAKQMGDDYLFSQLAGANIALFNSLGVKKIITLCPHCYNSFNTYYPPLGGNFQVISHVSLIRDLIHDAKIRPLAGSQKIAYHDPCYLGRHNNLFDDPREVIDSIGNIVELPRSRNNSFCCGAGGGNYWNDESGQRINYVRAREAFETGAKKIAAACPFCLLMLTDGVKMVSEEKVVFDIAEIIEQHIESNL